VSCGLRSSRIGWLAAVQLTGMSGCEAAAKA
jgi:hypothetical protein